MKDALDGWYLSHYGSDYKALPGPQPHSRAIVRLITFHVEKLTHDHGHTIFSFNDISPDERSEHIRQYEQKIRGWVSAVASLSPCTRNDVVDRNVGKEVQDFFLSNKGALVRIYGSHDLLTDFARRTQGHSQAPDGSLLAPYVGSLLAIALAQEFGTWEGEHSRWDDDPFPCVTLRNVDQSILDQRGVGEAFAAECRQIRRFSEGIEGFGTAQWYIDNGLAPLIASLCDQSRNFEQGIIECNKNASFPFERDDDEFAVLERGVDESHFPLSQALQLFRTYTAAHAFSNAVYFAFGNTQSREDPRVKNKKEMCGIRGMIATIKVIDNVVDDKGLFGRLCEMERDFSRTHNVLERLRSRRTIEKEWSIGERAAGHSVTKDGKSLAEVTDTLFENFPRADDREKAIELLCDFYEPCRSSLDPDRHSQITRLVLRELARGLEPPTPHGSLDRR